MTITAIVTSILGCTLFVIALGIRHQLMRWYVLSTIVGVAVRHVVLGYWGWNVYYYIYYTHMALHPLFQTVLLLSLYRRRTPDIGRWATSLVKVYFFGALMVNTWVDIITLLTIVTWSVAVIVLCQVLMTGARVTPENGGILAGLFVGSSIALCLYGDKTAGGEQWAAWVQQASIVPWTIWATTSIRAHSWARKAVAAAIQGRSVVPLLVAARNTIRQRLVQFQERLAPVVSAYWPPFANQFNRKG